MKGNMKENLSSNTARILQALQILVLLTSVKSFEESHLNSGVRLAQSGGISPTVMEFCWLDSPGDTRGLITAVQEGVSLCFHIVMHLAQFTYVLTLIWNSCSHSALQRTCSCSHGFLTCLCCKWDFYGLWWHSDTETSMTLMCNLYL